MDDPRLLVNRIIAGDPEAFRRLVEQYRRLVVHFVFRMVPAGPDQEDLCQEVFLKVYRNLSRFRFDCALSTWIGQIAYNTCLSHLDRKKIPLYDDLDQSDPRNEPAAPENLRPDAVLEQKETARILRRQVEQLPPVYRAIVTLFHLEQKNYAEIAQIMNLPEGTVKSYLFRARRRLKEKLTARLAPEDI